MKLIIFPPSLNCNSPSPFSMKAELLLRMAKVDYTTINGSNPSKGPNGKLPYMIDGEQQIADSHFIYQHIKQKFKLDLDTNLTKAQLATGLAFGRLCENHLYWSMVFARWVDPNFNHHVEVFFKTIPWGIRQLVIKKSRKSAAKAVYYHGIGRHSTDKIYKLGCDDLQAISTQLGNNSYFLGNEISSIDATIYSFLAANIYPDIETPMKHLALKLDNFKAYMARIENELSYSPPA